MRSCTVCQILVLAAETGGTVVGCDCWFMLMLRLVLRCSRCCYYCSFTTWVTVTICWTPPPIAPSARLHWHKRVLGGIVKSVVQEFHYCRGCLSSQRLAMHAFMLYTVLFAYISITSFLHLLESSLTTDPSIQRKNQCRTWCQTTERGSENKIFMGITTSV